MRGYVIPELGAHALTVLFMAGHNNIPMQFVPLITEYQRFGAQPLASQTRFIVPMPPLSASGRELIEWYDLGPMDVAPGGGEWADIEGLDSGTDAIKAYIAHEHVVRNVPLERIAIVGYCHGAGLAAYAAVKDMIYSFTDAEEGHMGPVVTPGLNLLTRETIRFKNTVDLYPEFEEAQMLANYHINLADIGLIAAMSSRMPGSLQLLRDSRHRPQGKTRFPHLLIMQGENDTAITKYYHDETMAYLDEIFCNCNGKMSDHVQYMLLPRFTHDLSPNLFLHVSSVLQQRVM